MADLWNCRRSSEAALSSELKELGEAVAFAFQRVDEATEYFAKFSTGDASGRVCALVIVKARNLVLGCFSLILDGLGQEAGALLRPTIEALELLMYLRTVPGAIDQAMHGQLPSAGARAKCIDGRFQTLREHLNTNASHLGLTDDSMRHLIDPKGNLMGSRSYNKEVLEVNLAVLLLFAASLGTESAATFDWCSGQEFPTSAESLLNKAHACFESGEAIFNKLVTRSAGSNPLG